MAPSRIRGSGEDFKSEASTTKEKHGGGLLVSKGRRNGNSTVTAGSALKDVTAAPFATNVQHGGQDGPVGV